MKKKKEAELDKKKALNGAAFPAGQPGRQDSVSAIKSKIDAVEAEKSLENFFRQVKMCRRTENCDGKVVLKKKTRQQDRNNGLELVRPAGRPNFFKIYTMYFFETRARDRNLGVF